jgi:hypothetical protein
LLEELKLERLDTEDFKRISKLKVIKGKITPEKSRQRQSTPEQEQSFSD